MKNFVLVLFLFFAKAVSAQDTTSHSSVVLHKDPRLDMLVKKQEEINMATRKANARTMKGYRLLIVNTLKRDEAVAAKTKIYTYFPELKAYLTYQTPYFKLKAGNFKTRDEAEKYRQNLSSFFPKGVFIINDIIEIKPEKDTENE